MKSLLELTGLDAAECGRRMQFIGFTDDDRECLLAAAPFIETIADGMVEAFYAHLYSFETTAAFLQDPALVRRLKAAQRRHFLELCTGPYDEAYFESRLRVGMAHARIRLQPHLYLGAYLVQLTYVEQKFRERFSDDRAHADRCIGALLKIIMLDISLATDAYICGGFVERASHDVAAYESLLAQEALQSKLREEGRREELLRMIVHDIRSPVAAIMATARAALRRYRDTSDTPGKQFALVEATGANLLQIIDNMVSHARAPGGELPLVSEPFDVAEVVSACVAQLVPFAKQTAHPLGVVELSPAPSLALDKMLVRRVVSNLLVNACRHTPAGTAIEVRCESSPDGFCTILVSDDGPGLPPAIRQAIETGSLRPRADAGAFADSGLGLPFCQMACRRMGGSLELVGNATRRGTAIAVRLPLGTALERTLFSQE